MLAAAAGLVYSTLVEPGRLGVEHVVVPVAKLPTALEGFRIAVLSDFHLYPFTQIDHIQAAVQLANSLRPDLTVLLGDFVDATGEAIHELAPVLGGLNSRHGLFAVLGNHDYWNDAWLIRRGLEKAGIVVLKNAGVALTVGSAQLYLAGLDSAWTGRPNIGEALAARRGDLPTVALVHEPDYADTVMRDGRVSLQLSGHSHGGQVRLPGVGALQLPSWGKRYDHGLYQLGSMSLYTNRGIGLVRLPVRFNCPPEVTEITLRAG